MAFVLNHVCKGEQVKKIQDSTGKVVYVDRASFWDYETRTGLGDGTSVWKSSKEMAETVKREVVQRKRELRLIAVLGGDLETKKALVTDALPKLAKQKSMVATAEISSDLHLETLSMIFELLASTVDSPLGLSVPDVAFYKQRAEEILKVISSSESPLFENGKDGQPRLKSLQQNFKQVLEEHRSSSSSFNKRIIDLFLERLPDEDREKGAAPITIPYTQCSDSSLKQLALRNDKSALKELAERATHGFSSAREDDGKYVGVHERNPALAKQYQRAFQQEATEIRLDNTVSKFALLGGKMNPPVNEGDDSRLPLGKLIRKIAVDASGGGAVPLIQQHWAANLGDEVARAELMSLGRGWDAEDRKTIEGESGVDDRASLEAVCGALEAKLAPDGRTSPEKHTQPPKPQSP